MILGYHAPLPPARTGVADYAAALAEGLQRHVELSVNPIDPAHVELYHLGNNEVHRAIYRKCLERPGIVVLHDAVLHHFFLGWLPEEVYVEEFVFNYGEWSRGLALELWRNRARSSQDPRYFHHPMIRRVCETATAIIVHNPGAAAMVERHAPGARVVEIPHLYEPAPLPDPVSVTRLRCRLGVPLSATLFAVFGYLRESKRLSAILRAFESVHRQAPNTALLIAGEFASSDLERSVGPLLSREGIRRAGFLSEPDFHRHAAAADVCINLRDPSAGESSGILVRLMGAGKPPIVTAGPETDGLPEAACIRIDKGPAETRMLADSMLWLATHPGARRAIGRRAAHHMATVHHVDHCVARYLDVVRSAPQVRAPRPRSRRAY